MRNSFAEEITKLASKNKKIVDYLIILEKIIKVDFIIVE